MAKFKYRVMNSDGEKINGTHEANSREEVIDFISGMTDAYAIKCFEGLIKF